MKRSKEEKEAEAEAIKNWNPRYKHNVIIYLWIYGILGAVTGITNDVALSYYKIVAPHLISGLNIFNALMSIMIAYAIVGVIDGLFTEFYLFNTPNGYANAYYIAAVIYVIASVLLLVFFAKKYNRILDDEKK